MSNVQRCTHWEPGLHGGVIYVHERDLEESAMSSTPPSIKPKIWKHYINKSFEVLKNNKRGELTEHVNNLHSIGSIKLTDEPKTEGSISFLDALISCKGGGSVKIQVKWKNPHTNEYLHSTPITC